MNRAAASSTSFAAAVVLLLLLLCGAGAQDDLEPGPRYAVGPGVVGAQRTASAGGIWNGHDYVVCWTFDDGHDDAVTWAGIANALGAKVTLYPSEGDIGSANYLSTAQMAALAVAGNEVSSTGLSHYNTWGLQKFVSTDFNAIPDSLRTEVDGAWVEAITGVAPASWGVDIGWMNYESAIAMQDEGYSGARAGYYYSATRGVQVSADCPGARRWDGLAPLRTDRPSNLYGIAAYPTSSDSEPDIAIFGSTATEESQANIEAKIDAALAWSDANGNAPIILIAHDNPPASNSEMVFAFNYLATLDVWQPTVSEMIAEYLSMSGIGYVRPPYWAPYARLNGYAASDELFVGPTSFDDLYNARPDTSAVGIQKAEFSNGQSWPDFTHYDGGAATGELDYQNPTTINTTGALHAHFKDYPLFTGEQIAVNSFEIDELTGMTIARAIVAFYPVTYSFDYITAVEGFNYGCVIGVTNEDFLVGASSVDMTYNEWTSGQAWPTNLDDIAWNSDFGWVFPYAVMTASTWSYVDVTDYIEERDGEIAMFMWHGVNSDGTTTPQGQRIAGNQYSTANRRCRLLVWYRDPSIDYDPPDPPTAPGEPGDPFIYAGDATVTLLWAASDSTDVAAYNIYRGVTAGSLALFDVTEAELQENEYVDSTTANDSTYFYAISAVDTTGNESATVDAGSGTPRARVVGFNLAALGDSSGSVDATIAATTATATTYVRRLFWPATEAEPDTTAMAWIAAGSVDLGGVFDTGETTPTAEADSGGIVLTWGDADNEDGFRVDYNPNSNGWATLAFTVADDTTHTHASADTPAPRRGELDYRVRSFQVDGGDTLWSSPAQLDTLVYNQAVRINSRMFAAASAAAPYVAATAADSRLLTVEYTGGAPTSTDTVGYSGAGANTSQVYNYSYGARFVASETGDVTTVSVYLEVASGDLSIKGAVTDSVYGLLGSGELVAVGPSSGWFDIELDTPVAVVQGQAYYMVFHSDESEIGFLMHYASEAAGTPYISFYDQFIAYADFPIDPFTPVSGFTNRRYLAYATIEY